MYLKTIIGTLVFASIPLLSPAAEKQFNTDLVLLNSSNEEGTWKLPPSPISLGEESQGNLSTSSTEASVQGSLSFGVGEYCPGASCDATKQFTVGIVDDKCLLLHDGGFLKLTVNYEVDEENSLRCSVISILT